MDCYEELGRVGAALTLQADAALESACSQTGLTRDHVMDAFLNLVTINEQGIPTRRRAALDALPVGTDTFEPFVTRRLVSIEAEGEHTFAAMSHDALLVNWPPLKDEIDMSFIALRARGVVETAASDWEVLGRDRAALLQGRMLAKAMVDTGAELQPVTDNDDSTLFGPKRRVTLPKWRLVTRVDLNETARAYLEASMRADRSARSHQKLRAILMIVVLALVCALAVLSTTAYLECRNWPDTGGSRA